MPVRVTYRPIGRDIGGFVVDTPHESLLIMDEGLSPKEQAALAAELLDADELPAVPFDFGADALPGSEVGAEQGVHGQADKVGHRVS